MSRRSILLGLICIFVLLSALLTGCKNTSGPAEEQKGTEESFFPVLSPEKGAFPAASEPVSEEDANEAFRSLDRELFAYLLMRDRCTAISSVHDPASFGIDPELIPTWWGEYSEEWFLSESETKSGFLEKLREIPRDRLSEKYIFAYDTLESYLALDSTLGDFWYYREPLATMGGEQSRVLTALGSFELHSREDIENYLLLLSDVPRFFEQIMAFEMEKADRGAFMPKSALTVVLSQIEAVTDISKPCFLIPLFNEKVSSVSGISPAERERYSDRHAQEIRDGLIPAYRMLHDGLSALSPKCRYEEGFASLEKAGSSWFETRMKLLSCSDEPASDIFSALEREAYHCLIGASAIRLRLGEEAERALFPTLGDANEDLRYLRTLTENRFSALPEHSLRILTAPFSLRDSVNQAGLLKPAIDDGGEPVLMLNGYSGAEANMQILAHETYPGHLTQRLLLNGNEEVSLSQKVLDMIGYEEGWAAEAEMAFIRLQAQFPEDLLLMQFYENMVDQTILPALVSIRVNYFGDGPDKIRAYLNEFGRSEDTEVFYRYAVIAPEYHLPYAVGYTMLSRMARRAEQDLGQVFSLPDFLMEYLSFGPGYSSALSDRMDLWVDARFSAGA